ncbi:alginate export family protein [Vibrio sp. 404]|uniref:Alginate export family protein n=1 Tax=Vibrio marinisediminis TaxID=2758441 RepID=A0A7W2FU83_9VIBR|nr:alginate export family protein [Vibrio marinisediminis]MBA5764369.1 alginate export family protein [Vibrio marinisediminis]
MKNIRIAIFLSIMAIPAHAEFKQNTKFGVESRSTSSSTTQSDLDVYKAEYTASYLTAVNSLNSVFVKASAILTDSSEALNALDNDLINQSTDDEDNAIFRLREAWWEKDRHTGYKKDAITFGLKRIKMSPYWIDDEIESLSWHVETTTTSWQLGLGQQLTSYNTSTTLNIEDKGKFAAWGRLQHDWMPYHSLHLNTLFVNQHRDIATDEMSDSFIGPLNGNYVWLGLGGSHNWLSIDDVTSNLGYLIEATALTGTGDTFNNRDDSWQRSKNNAFSVLGGIRIQPLDVPFFIGSTVAYASGSNDGKSTYFQSGYQSNKSKYLGTRDQAYQFNYALDASLSNLATVSLFSSYQVSNEWSINGAISSYLRADSDTPAYRRNRALETTGTQKDIGTGLDFQAIYRSKQFLGSGNKGRVKLSTSQFITGDALESYDDETRISLEITVEL